MVLSLTYFGFLSMSPLGRYAGRLSVDFTHVKKVQQRFLAICILTFHPKTSIKV